MKGLWGRRVYGRVMKGETNTWFCLMLSKIKGRDYKFTMVVPNTDLEMFPELYGQILDHLSDKLEDAIAQ